MAFNPGDTVKRVDSELQMRVDGTYEAGMKDLHKHDWIVCSWVSSKGNPRQMAFAKENLLLVEAYEPAAEPEPDPQGG